MPIDTGRAEAAELVDELWSAILVVAAELVTARRLDGCDVLELVHALVATAA